MKLPKKIKFDYKKLVQPISLVILAGGFVYGVHQLAVSYDEVLYFVVVIATFGLVHAVNNN